MTFSIGPLRKRNYNINRSKSQNKSGDSDCNKQMLCF